MISTTSSPSFDIDTVQQAVQAVWPGLKLEWADEIDSTNTELMRRASAGNHAPTLLVAGTQTAGRGRMGKPWQTQTGAALILSLGLPLAPRNWSGLSLVVGVATCAALSHWQASAQQGQQTSVQSPNGRLGLKWPNDVWVMSEAGQGQKMAGILIETAAKPTAMPSHSSSHAQDRMDARYTVIGMGINLLPQTIETTNAGVAPISVAQWSGKPPETQALLTAIVPTVLQLVKQFESQGFASFQEGFSTWDVLHHREVRLSDGRVGQCLGVDAEGVLLLATASGVESISSGEVSVRPVVR